LAFCSYLHHQYFNWAAVPGGRISNSPTSQSPIVGGKHIATHQTISGFSRIHFNKVKKIIFSKLL
jgi:hypothetical protein